MQEPTCRAQIKMALRACPSAKVFVVDVLFEAGIFHFNKSKL